MDSNDCGFGDDLTSQSGIDFNFVADPRSLMMILENRELSPSVLKFRSSLTPAVHTNKKNKDLEYFEGKNGALFCRPKHSAPASTEKNTENRKRFGRTTLLGIMPKRCIGVGSAEKSAEKGFPFRGNASEKKCASVPEVLPRMSISERKPVAGALQSRVPRPASVARKGLDFNDRPNMKGGKSKAPPVVEISKPSQSDDSFEFPKPLPVDPSVDDQKIAAANPNPSLMELIMTRQDQLAGFPRESFSFLLRQSLSAAEVERMFEDDSTGNFEKLEQRLKTPKRPNLVPQVAMKASVNDVETARAVPAKLNIEDQLKALEIEDDQPGNESLDHEKGSAEEYDEKSQDVEDIRQDVHNDAVKHEKDIQVKSDVPNEDSNGIKFVTYTEEDLANMEVIEYEFEDPNMSLRDLGIFDKSLSLTDLRGEDAEEEDACDLTDGRTCLPRSLSDLNVDKIGDEEFGEIVQEHLDDLERCRQEQADIERQLQNLMLASLQRKEQFRQVWGVSPKSINQKRNQKLIIGAHEILFNDPEPKSEPTLTEINNIGIYEIFDEKVEIGNVEFEGQSDVMVPTMGEFEGILPSLDFSIPSDLFSQYIDANFPSEFDDEYDVGGNAFKSVDEVFASHVQIESTDDHFTQDDVTPNEVCFNETAKGEMIDKLDAEDMEIESDAEEAAYKFEVLELAAQDQVCEEMLESIAPTFEKEIKVDVEQISAPNVVDFRSLIAAAKSFKKEFSKKSKSVRFLTPQKSDFVMYDYDGDDHSDEGNADAKENVQNVGSDPHISVNIPVNFGNSKGSISFNESGIFSKESLVHTPIPKSNMFRMSAKCEDIEDESYVLNGILPTPMALRDISNKAQQSLASLYQDSPTDEDAVSVANNEPIQKKLFDDDSEDLTN